MKFLDKAILKINLNFGLFYYLFLIFICIITEKDGEMGIEQNISIYCKLRNQQFNNYCVQNGFQADAKTKQSFSWLKKISKSEY